MLDRVPRVETGYRVPSKNHHRDEDCEGASSAWHRSAVLPIEKWTK